MGITDGVGNRGYDIRSNLQSLTPKKNSTTRPANIMNISIELLEMRQPKE